MKKILSEAKKRLLELEGSGHFLFHGSSISGIETFEPRQSYTYPDPKNDRKKVPDGPPSVSASPWVDIAIFRSITSHKNIRNKSGFRSHFGSMVDGDKVELHFGLSSKALDNFKPDTKGFVYVFNKNNFFPRNDEKGMEWLSESPVSPVEVIEVHIEDLPDNIDHL